MSDSPLTTSLVERSRFEGNDNNFNFLRLFFATVVLLSHSVVFTWPRFSESQNYLGDLSVDGFFAISGYLISASWFRSSSNGSFLLRRVLRIYPAFLISTLLVGLVAAPWLFGRVAYFRALNLQKFFTLALLLQYHGPPAFVSGGYYEFNAAVWTIHEEFWCCLLLLVLGASGLLARRRVILGLFAVANVLFFFPTVIVRAYHPYLMPMPAGFMRLAIFFLAGALVFLYREKVVFSARGAVAAIVVIGLGLYFSPVVELALAFGWTYLVLSAAFIRLPLLNPFKRAWDISYGTYLYGWPIQFSLAFLYPHISFPLHVILSCALAYICGTLSWHLVEKHLVSKRHGGEAKETNVVSGQLENGV